MGHCELAAPTHRRRPAAALLRLEEKPVARAVGVFDLTAPATLKSVCFAFLTLGVLWRLVRYTLQFPIWGDEAFVCLNFLDQNYAALLGPLKCGQVAPLLFLWGELAAYQWLGGSELAVRLIPLLAGLGSMFLFYRLAWRTLPPLAATIAVGILAVAYWPVAMSNTVKPYSLDLLMALALLVPAVEWLRSPSQSRWLTVLTGLCPLAIFSSYPAVFVAGAVSLAILPELWRNARRLDWARYAVLNVVLIGAFLLHFGLVATRQLSPESGRLESYLQNYWADGFPPANIGEFGPWLLRIHTGRMCAYPIGSSNGGSVVTTLLFVVGLICLVRQRRVNPGLLVLLTAPFLLNFVAAVLGKYPYGGCCRLSQHLAPAICLLAGWGLSTVIEQFSHTRTDQRRWMMALCVGLALVPAVGMARDFYRPYKDLRVLHARERFQQLLALVAPHDRICVLCPREQVDPVHRWLLSQYGNRIEWDSRAVVESNMAEQTVWGLDFHGSASPDLEAMYFGQYSLQHAEVDCRVYQRGQLRKSSRFDLSQVSSTNHANWAVP